MLTVDSDGGAPADNQALHWTALAAETGHAKAQRNLCTMNFLDRGASQSNAEALAKALKWWRQAAAQDNLEALDDLGRLYSGYLISKDISFNLDYVKAA